MQDEKLCNDLFCPRSGPDEPGALQTASQLSNGKLTNAFVWRMAFGTLALTAALVLEGYHISRLWAVVCLLQAVAMMVPAFMEYSLNVKEDEV